MVVEIRYSTDIIESLFFYQKRVNKIIASSDKKGEIKVKPILDERYERINIALAHHSRRKNLFPYLKFIDKFIEEMMPYEDERDDLYIDFQSFFKS